MSSFRNRAQNFLNFFGRTKKSEQKGVFKQIEDFGNGRQTDTYTI
jgi:hypothetical protein